jgi:4-amino-4-deoxy-L-arabinose transferase-like glycosyltransferase
VLAERNRAGEIGVLLSVAVFVLCAAMYALATPFGQAPDEKSHLAYVQLVAQHLQLPVNSPERQQPPLYYLIAALVYRLTGSIGWVQALSIACGTAAVLVTGLCARELWPAKPKRWVLTALLAATLPQFQFISASVSNDAFAVMVAALVTLLMIRVIMRPTVSWLPWAIGLAFAAVLLAKETDYFLIAVLVVMVVRFWPRRDLAGALVPMIGLPAMLAGWWFVRNLTTFDSLLPPFTPLYTDAPLRLTDASLAYDWWSLTFKSFFAVFGNMSTQIQFNGTEFVYTTLQVGSAVIGVSGVAVAAIRWRPWPARARWLAGACIVVPMIALTQMAVSSISVDYQPQGRYLFVAGPVLAIGTVFAVGALAARLPRWSGAGAGTVLVIAGLFLDVFGLYTAWFNLVLT